MGLFSKSSQTPTGKTTINSIIGKGMTITGDVSFSGKLKIEGEIKGNVQGEHLIIGASGTVNGDIHTETCTCQGEVLGNIRARDLKVVKECRIQGNVETVNFAVESGASLIGEVKVEDNKDLRLIKTAATQDESELKTATAQ